MSILAFVNERLAPETRLQPLVDLLHWRILQRGNGGIAFGGPDGLRLLQAHIGADGDRPSARHHHNRIGSQV